VLSGLPLAEAETCTDTTIPPSNPDSIYTVNSDGTASDTRSDLMWKRCAEGQTWIAGMCTGSATSYSWESALTQAVSSKFADYSDWRLPSVKELSTLVEPCRYSPAINDSVFPATPSSGFLSGSPVASRSSSAWGVYFGGGYVGSGWGVGTYVRLVRGGQSFASFDLASIQTITFGAAPSVQVGKTGSVSATGGASGQPVIFSSNTPTICTISGSLVTGVAVGTCTIAANQAASGIYTAAPQVTQNISVSPVPTYTLTVNSTGAANVPIAASPTTYAGSTNYSKTGVTGGTSLTLTAPSTASGTPFLGWIGCTASSGVFCTLTLNATTTVTAGYRILLSQAIAFGTAPSAVTVGGTGSVSATASSGLPVSFTSLTSGVCTLSGSTVSGIAAGTCIVAANQPGDSSYSPAPQATQSFNVTAAQIFTYTLTVSSSGASNVAIAASPSLYSGTTRYSKTGIAAWTTIDLVAPSTVGSAHFDRWSGCYSDYGVYCTVIVTAATSVTAIYNYVTPLFSQVITFGATPTIVVNGTGTVSATASSGLPVTFSSLTTNICTISGNTVIGIAAGTCAIAANQGGNSTYSAAPQKMQSFAVVSPGTALFSDGFEVSDGWLQKRTGSGTAVEWSLSASETNPSAMPHGGWKMGKFNSYSATSGIQSRLYQSQQFSF
jgi:hypothetical protein